MLGKAVKTISNSYPNIFIPQEFINKQSTLPLRSWNSQFYTGEFAIFRHYIAIPFCSPLTLFPLRSCSKAPRGVGLQVGHPGWGNKWSPRELNRLQPSKVKIRCIFTYGKCTLTQICFLPPSHSLYLHLHWHLHLHLHLHWLIDFLIEWFGYIYI